MSRFFLAALFISAGIGHFRSTEAYMSIMPPQLPYPRELVWFSGICEIVGGVGLFIPRTRKWAAWGLVALLIAVYPANIYSAFHGMRVGELEVPKWLLWLRLPLQLPLIWWAYSNRE
ncbi:DoxX family membrane protein [bacterium]|nr:MAG: DoxX family membrane protein [bacterium]